MYQRSTGFALETPALTQRPSPPRERQPVAPWSTPASASHLSESPIAQRCRTGALNHRPHRRDEVNLSAFLAQRTYARRDLHPHDPGHGFSEPSSESDPRAVRRGLATSGRCLESRPRAYLRAHHHPHAPDPEYGWPFERTLARRGAKADQLSNAEVAGFASGGRRSRR